MNIESSRAIVTGATRGIGLEIVKALLAGGARVAGWARSDEALQKLEKDLGENFLGVKCDVRSPEEVRSACATSRQHLGGIDTLINNAGIGHFGAVEDLSAEDLDAMLSTNINGVFHCTREVVPVMKEQQSGHIVNIASIAGLIGNPNLSGYNASKYAVRGMSDALFKELRDDGIKVSCVCPGSTDTEFSSGRRPKSTTHKMRASEIAEVVLHILERSDNFLISEVVVRPLKPKG